MSGGCCGHGHGGGHGHSEPGPGTAIDPASDRSTEFSLHMKIKWEEFCVLNEASKDSGKKVFKSWKERLSDDVSEFHFQFDPALIIRLLHYFHVMYI